MFRVLIVDDEEMMLEGLERILNKIPEVIVSAKFRSSLQAREYLEHNRVDIVFTDIRMPVMDGLELSRWISNHQQDCHIVLISAFNEFSYAQKAMKFGIKYYLMKPIRLADVSSVIRQLSEEREQRERRLLWKRDYMQEIQEAEMYHSLTDDPSDIADQKPDFNFFVEYQITYGKYELDSVRLNTDLLRAGISNIVRWEASSCLTVLAGQKTGEFRYILFASSQQDFPKDSTLRERIKALMGINVMVQMGSHNDIKELSFRPRVEIVQDEISDEVIIKAKQFIVDNLSKNISRSDVAAAVYMDSAYFSKYFKKKTGMNFHDYLQSTRIEKVKELLAEGRRVQDAANEAGYSNRNYFNQVFKQYTGFSPSDYRKRIGKES